MAKWVNEQPDITEEGMKAQVEEFEKMNKTN